MVPDLIIDDTKFLVDEQGWWKSKYETLEEASQRAKEIMKEFKDLYHENIGKNLVAITHGAFLNAFVCTFTNNLGIAERNPFPPDNNSMCILDFFPNKHEIGGEVREYIDVRISAYGLIIHK